MDDEKETKITNCKSCKGQLFSPSSKRCHHCGAYQNWMSRLNFTTTTLALVTALVSVATMFFAQVFPHLSSERVDATLFNIENDHLILAFNNDTNDITYLKSITLMIKSDVEDFIEVNLGINNVQSRVISPRSTSVLEINLSDVSSATLTDLDSEIVQTNELRKGVVTLVFFNLFPHRIPEILNKDGPSFEIESEGEINCKVKIHYTHDIKSSAKSLQEFIEISATNLPSSISKLDFDSSLSELAYASKINTDLLRDIDYKGFKYVSQNLCSEIIYVSTMKKAFDLSSSVTDSTPKLKLEGEK